MAWEQSKHPRGQGGRFASKGSAKEVIKSMVPKDSYTKSASYQANLKRFRQADAGVKLARSQYDQAGKQIDKECPVLPYDEWDASSKKMADMLGRSDYIRHGFAPRRNQDIYDKLRQQQSACIDRIKQAQAQSSLARSQLEWERQMAHDEQVENWKRPTDLAKYDGQEIPGFKTDTTGVPYYDEQMKNGRGFIVTMSPKSYLEYCAYEIFDNATMESTINQVDEQSADKYASMMDNGQKFDMPYLNFNKRQQEGRHRAVAAMINGQKKIPVFILR